MSLKQMKYAVLSSVILYHFERLLISSTRASLMTLNHDADAMFSHDLIINLRIGTIRQTVGSRELKNIWVAFADSYIE